MNAATKPPVAYWREAIRDSRTLSGPAKGVAHALASRMKSESLQCWPSQQQIQADSGYSRPTVQRALAELKAAGFLRWKTEKDRGHNTYAGTFAPAEVASQRGDLAPEVASQGGDGSLTERHKLERELENNPPLPLQRRDKHGGTVPGQTRTKIPRGPRPERLAAKTPSERARRLVEELSTRHRSLAEDLTDTSWADL